MTLKKWFCKAQWDVRNREWIADPKLFLSAEDMTRHYVDFNKKPWVGFNFDLSWTAETFQLQKKDNYYVVLDASIVPDDSKIDKGGPFIAVYNFVEGTITFKKVTRQEAENWK